MKIIHSPFR